jgi:ABC-type multidrug transport system fused ATPase/permease subunit
VLRRLLTLFDRDVKLRLLLLIAGSLTIAVAEAAAMLAILPLMALLSGASPDSDAQLRLLDRLFGQPSPDRLAAYVALLVLAGFLMKGVCALAIRWWALGFIFHQLVDTSSRLLRYFLQAPYSMHLRRGSADFLRVLNEGASGLYGGVLLGTVSAITEAITIAVLAIALFVASPLETAVLATYFGGAAWILQRTMKPRARQAGHGYITSILDANRAALHGLGGIKEVRLRHEEALFVDKYARARKRGAEAQRLSGFLTELPKHALELVFIVGIGLLAFIAYSQSNPAKALGTLAIVGVAGFRVLPGAVRLVASINGVRGALPSLEVVEPDLLAMIRLKTAIRTAEPERLALSQALVLNDVRFRYDADGPEVIRGVTLNIPAGSSTALVGGSGAGKTTLVDIVLGLHQPSAGTILADGVEVSRNLDAWQAGLAMVPQDVFLLDDTLRANIRFGGTPAPEQDPLMDLVLEQAQLDDVLSGLPDGLETTLGERGSRLSGGQRQRVGIARALYRQPQLLVLDEATSALDNETEHRIAQTLSKLHGSMTVLIVAHRLSTVRHCDRIVVLQAGAIRTLGTFEELLERDEYFANLVRLGSLH